MKKLIFMISGAICLAISVQAQNEIDALRYSFFDISGSARYTAMGGAFGALGADMTTMSRNPAGLGMYRRSEFSFSTSLAMNNSDALYEDNLSSADNTTFGFNSIGMVGSYPTEDERLPRLNFGIAYNKLVNFNESISISGNVENTSLLDVFVDQAQGINSTELTDAFPFAAGLAYQTYLINPTDTLGSGLYYHEIPYGELTQSKTINRTGSMGETVISGAANIRDQFYFGASLGFPSIRFEEHSTYREDVSEESLELDHYVFRDNLSVTGNGFNMKAGVIVKVADWIRFGAAVHTPTWLTLNDTYDRTITATFKGENPYTWDSPVGNYEYRIKTPGRYMANMAVIAGKIGVISADYEFVNYSSSKLKTSHTDFDDYDFAVENDVIDNIYKGTHNVSVGAEWRAFKALRIRAGIAYQQSPYKNGVVENGNDIITYSGGIGYRRHSFFAELAYSYKEQSSDYYLYDPQKVDVAGINSIKSQAVLSIGFRY